MDYVAFEPLVLEELKLLAIQMPGWLLVKMVLTYKMRGISCQKMCIDRLLVVVGLVITIQAMALLRLRVISVAMLALMVSGICWGGILTPKGFTQYEQFIYLSQRRLRCTSG